MTQTEPVVQGKTEVRAPDGSRLTGAGVGIAIVDTGIDATHPGLVYGDAVQRNVKFVHRGTIEMDDTDTTSGHGTAVAGIAAARGHRSEYDGLAPGAGLYGMGAGEFFSVYFTLQSFDWILTHHDRVDPPIRVVVNAWGNGGTVHDPTSPTSKAVKMMVDRDITVVFAAGNAGGDGFQDRTTGECNHPAEGVVCVGAYRDRSRLDRQGDLADFSSRGSRLFPNTWPDLVAPGDRVTTTLALSGTTTATGVWQETPSTLYTTLSGTSMAAPMVGAAAALLYQLDPEIRPADVERVLERSAYAFDGATGLSSSDARFDGSTHDRGHGLLDVQEAVRLWVANDGPTDDTGSGVPTEDERDPLLDDGGILDEAPLPDPGSAGDALDDLADPTEDLSDTLTEEVGLVKKVLGDRFG